jgi:hypothetical protein
MTGEAIHGGGIGQLPSLLGKNLVAALYGGELVSRRRYGGSLRQQ